MSSFQFSPLGEGACLQYAWITEDFTNNCFKKSPLPPACRQADIHGYDSTALRCPAALLRGHSFIQTIEFALMINYYWLIVIYM